MKNTPTLILTILFTMILASCSCKDNTVFQNKYIYPEVPAYSSQPDYNEVRWTYDQAKNSYCLDFKNAMTLKNNINSMRTYANELRGKLGEVEARIKDMKNTEKKDKAQ